MHAAITHLFDPCRFTAEEKAKRPQLSHMPFGFGPRNCIGMRFALLEAKIALIELLKRYTFVRTADTEVRGTELLQSICFTPMPIPIPDSIGNGTWYNSER